MAVTRQQKIDILTGLVEQFRGAKSIGFATTTGLTVDEFAGLRGDLREVSATYTIAKKTLIKKAIKDALGIELDLGDLPGQVGVVCSNEDPVAGLGAVNKMVKDSKGEKIDWNISIFEGEIKDQAETKVIAAMPSRDTLLGRLVGSMQSPISGLARFFDAAAKDLETKTATTVGELKGAADSPAPAPAVEEKKEETPKTEEVKPEEPKVEAPVEEAKAEEVTEAPKEEVAAEATPSEETPAAEEKKED